MRVFSECTEAVATLLIHELLIFLRFDPLYLALALLVLKKKTETSNRMLTKFVSIGSYSPEVRTFGTLITSTKVFSLL